MIHIHQAVSRIGLRGLSWSLFIIRESGERLDAVSFSQNSNKYRIAVTILKKYSYSIIDDNLLFCCNVDKKEEEELFMLLKALSGLSRVRQDEFYEEFMKSPSLESLKTFIAQKRLLS